MVRVAILSLLIFFASNRLAKADPIDLTVEVRSGVEYATSLTRGPAPPLGTPVEFFNDAHTEFEASALTTFKLGSLDSGLSYTFDKWKFFDLPDLNRRHHIARFFLSGAPQEGHKLTASYMYLNDRRNSPFGGFDIHLLNARYQWRERRVFATELLFRPAAMLEWEDAKFTNVIKQDGTEFTGAVGAHVRPGSSRWHGDANFSFGRRDTRKDRFAHDFIEARTDYSFAITQGLPLIAAPGTRAVLSLVYREEWYVGISSDDLGQRHDREYKSVMTLTRPVHEFVNMIVRLEVEDHNSNYGRADFLEYRAKISTQIRF